MAALAALEDASRRLALELQLRDVDELSTTPDLRSRKRRAPDFEVALKVYQEHLTSEIQSVGGRLPPSPVAQASSSRPKKRVVTGKRRLPAQNRRAALPREAKASSSETAVATQSLAGQVEQEASSSASASGSALRCDICFEVQTEIPTLRAPCNDVYCALCLARHFTTAITGASRFPPECCSTPIPLEGALSLLPAELVARFQRKQLESSTPNPRYCHNPACGEFLPLNEFQGDRGQCSSCRVWTCILCRAAAHDGVCPNDPVQNDIRTMAKPEGWRQCVQCGNLVERIWGCLHMTCRCGGHFCYRCGRRWKTCSCAVYP